MILLLFSGGIESTVLLKYFLKETNKSVHVLFNELHYDNLRGLKYLEQTKTVKNILNYFKKNYRNFDFSSTKLTLNNVNSIQQKENGFGFDEQWNIFFASMYAKLFGIKDIWIGHFSYVDTHAKLSRGFPSFWFNDGTLEKYAFAATVFDFKFFNFLKINFPAKNFNKTGIDSFESKKEAFNYLEPELKKMVRSCEGIQKFCGECIKCTQYKILGIEKQ